MSNNILFQALRGHGAFAAFAALTLLSLSGCVGGADDPPDDGEASTSNDESPLSGLTTTHTGEGTYYAKVSNGGNCSYGALKSTLFGAMNHTDYANSEACGMCTEITGPNGKVKVQIVDQCPECKPGDIDLSEDAFLKLAPLAKGRIPISWKYVPCDVQQGGIVYHYKDGTHQWWNAVQIRNAKRGVAKIEAKKNGQFITLQRESYNYFIASSGLGTGPFEFRVTDVAGNVITESGVAFKADSDVASPGQKQFP